MAERRMFAKNIIDSDLFLEMPISTQLLYFHLSMRADDDGFINNPKKIQRMIGCSDDDIKILITKQFIIPFDSGIIVIKHWKIHNYIQKDRYRPSSCAEKEMVTIENGVYSLDTECIQNVYSLDTQVRLGKDRLGKVNNTIDQKSPPKSAIESEFETIWNEYPRKEGKKKAFACYERARKKGTSFDAVLNGVKSYADYVKANSTEMQYIKQGGTYFNGECWNDVYGGGNSGNASGTNAEIDAIWDKLEK